MKRISSKMTFFYKRVFPIVMLGLLLLFLLFTSLMDWRGAKGPPAVVLLVPVFIAVLVFFLFKKLIFDLVDEVWDAGDTLIVRNKGQEDRIVLSDIMNISYSQFVNPPRATLMLRTPSLFGSKVSFTPPVGMTPWADSPIIDDLIRRVDDARRRKR